MTKDDRLVIVTGGPGAGKTSLIEALARAGFRTSEEGGRRVIRDQLARGGDALPWADRLRFAELMLEHDVRAHTEARGAAGTTFFDRGAPDVLGYLKLCGIEAPAGIAAAARRLAYSNRVFLAPFWPEIFVNDEERKQSGDEARRTADVMSETYRALGYEIVELPKTSVEQRVEFVLDASGRKSPERQRG